jgi:ElaB/YqjD/DUF883 family membrane-anchored ribosome-binding protein
MNETGKQLQEAAGQMQDVYDNGKRKLNDLAKTASDRSRQAMSVTDEWVHDNPWLALGIVAGVGLLIGLLVSQSGGRDD